MVTVQFQAVPQWREALDRANEVKAYQRAVKARLKARDVSVAEVLADAGCGSMRVGDLLVALPAVGRVKRDRLLRAAGAGPLSTVGGLTERQRGVLLLVLREREE